MWFEISHFCWLALSSADKLRPVTLSCKCHLVNHLFNWIREILGRKHLAKCQTTCTGNITDNLQVPSKKNKGFLCYINIQGIILSWEKKKKSQFWVSFLATLDVHSEKGFAWNVALATENEVTPGAVLVLVSTWCFWGNRPSF